MVLTMPEFLRLTSLSEALQRWFAETPAPNRQSQMIDVAAALGRVLAEDVRAGEDLPAFRRSTVDGFAVRAADTYGASPTLPALLHVRGEVPMGKPATISLATGEAAVVHTGGMIPPDADAVVMVEDTQAARDEIEVMRPAQSGTNVLQQGEDLRAGEVALLAGTVLRPQEIGGLMALGITRVPVTPRPRVAILSSGDEIVSPAERPGPGQVRDVNQGTLLALTQLAGGEGQDLGIAPDRADALEAMVRRAMTDADMVILSAGSSVSYRDITSEVIARLGPPGILQHGLSVKPGKPTILAVCQGLPLLGLPGNPVSALIIAQCLAVPMIRRLAGAPHTLPVPGVPAILAENIPSETGREDLVPVALKREEDGWKAYPVRGRSNLIFTLARADGIVRLAPEVTGLIQGAEVDVYLFSAGIGSHLPIGGAS